MTVPWCHDGIEVSNLRLKHAQRIATDAWGRRKEQPVFVTARLSFRIPFESAAAADRLDSSTVHYGQLSKALVALTPSPSWETLDDFAGRLQLAVLEVVSGAHILSACDIEVSLPKASLLGRQVVYSQKYEFMVGLPAPRLQRALSLAAIQLAVVVGVNEHERREKQPLLFFLWFAGIPASASDSFVAVERHLVQIVEHSAFETLESLILSIVAQLHRLHLSTHMPHASIRLRIEKPLAVPFADAPAVEVCRTPLEMAQLNERHPAFSESKPLKVYRPYGSSNPLLVRGG